MVALLFQPRPRGQHPGKHGIVQGHDGIELNDEDAFRRQLGDGDLVEVRSPHGHVRGRARVTSGPRQGVVFVAFYDAKLLINQVVGSHVDSFSREAFAPHSPPHPYRAATQRTAASATHSSVSPAAL